MYDYGYGYGYDSYDYGSAASAVGALAGFGIFMWIIVMAIGVVSIISMWKLFTKAGKKGWAAIVPVYNMIVMIEIAELPMWYIALFFVPFANIYAMFKIYIEIAHKFGKSTGFGVGMVFLNIIFIPMLAFGKAEYKGGVSVPVNNNVNPQPNLQNNNMQYNPVNEQVNMPNNNLQPNVMDVNSSVGAQPMFDVNMQNNGNAFQPVGNINNNVTDMNVMEPASVNNVMGPVNNEVSGIDMNSSVVGPVSDVTSVNEPIMNSPVNNMEPVNNTVVQPMENNVVNPINSVSPVSEPIASVQVNSVVPNVNQNNVNSMTKTCPNCGNQVDFSAMFCTNCGHNL